MLALKPSTYLLPSREIDPCRTAALNVRSLLEALGDDDGLSHVWYALAWAANVRAAYEDWAYAMERAMLHAGRAG